MSGASVLQINSVLKHISEHFLGEKYTVQRQNNGLKFTSSAYFLQLSLNVIILFVSVDAG